MDVEPQLLRVGGGEIADGVNAPCVEFGEMARSYAAENGEPRRVEQSRGCAVRDAGASSNLHGFA